LDCETKLDSFLTSLDDGVELECPASVLADLRSLLDDMDDNDTVSYNDFHGTIYPSRLASAPVSGATAWVGLHRNNGSVIH